MAQDIISRIKQGVDDSFYSISTDGWSQPTRSPQLQRFTFYYFYFIIKSKCYNTLGWSGFPEKRYGAGSIFYDRLETFW